MTESNVDKLPSNFLIDLIMVWGELIPGAIRITQNRELVITKECTRHEDILKDMKRVILLDATGSKKYLAQLLKLEPEQIIEIEEQLRSFKNLTVINVHMEGLGSSNVE